MTDITEAEIVEIALTMAAQTGEPNPTRIQFAQGTRDRINDVASRGRDQHDRLDGERRCYLVVIEGRFIGHNLSRPAGAAVQTGTVMTILLDAETGQCRGLGLGDHHPSLEELGTPVITPILQPHDG